jgi:hypothetical protein
MAKKNTKTRADAEAFEYISEKDEEAATALRARKRDWRALLAR